MPGGGVTWRVVGIRNLSVGSLAFTCQPGAIVISTAATPDATRSPADTGSVTAAAGPAPSTRTTAKTPDAQLGTPAETRERGAAAGEAGAEARARGSTIVTCDGLIFYSATRAK